MNPLATVVSSSLETRVLLCHEIATISSIHIRRCFYSQDYVRRVVFVELFRRPGGTSYDLGHRSSLLINYRCIAGHVIGETVDCCRPLQPAAKNAHDFCASPTPACKHFTLLHATIEVNRSHIAASHLYAFVTV